MIERLWPNLFDIDYFHLITCLILDQYVLEMQYPLYLEKSKLLTGAFVCRHQVVFWNSVLSNQFGQQAAVSMAREGSYYLLRKWFNQYPITAYVSGTLGHIYPEKPFENNEKDQWLKHIKGDDTRDNEEVGQCICACQRLPAFK